jgi:hypothetical protein
MYLLGKKFTKSILINSQFFDAAILIGTNAFEEFDGVNREVLHLDIIGHG